MKKLVILVIMLTATQSFTNVKTETANEMTGINAEVAQCIRHEVEHSEEHGYEADASEVENYCITNAQ